MEKSKQIHRILLSVVLTGLFGSGVPSLGGGKKPNGNNPPPPTPCTEPCWHDSFVPAGAGEITDIAIQRQPGGLMNRIVALSNGAGILLSQDTGKSFVWVNAGPSGSSTYNIAAGPLRPDGLGGFLPGLVQVASGNGLYENAQDDLTRWSKINTSRSGLPTNLRITFVGYSLSDFPSPTGDIQWDLYAVAYAGDLSVGGLYKRNSDGTWRRVTPNLNVVAIAGKIAVTKPCGGVSSGNCQGGAIWIRSQISAQQETWSRLPDGQFGPKTMGFNDVAGGGVWGGCLATNADFSVPYGNAIFRIPPVSTLQSWDDVVPHDQVGAGGLGGYLIAYNLRYDGCGSTSSFPNIGYGGSTDEVLVGSNGEGLFRGLFSSIEWTSVLSDSNWPHVVTKWIMPYSTQDGRCLKIASEGPRIFWHR